MFPSWHCSDCSNDEDPVLCVEGDYEAVLESDSIPFAVSSLAEVSAISIDCDATRNISLAGMTGITRAQIGRMQRFGRCHSLPPLPSCLKELCVINVKENNILTAIERQKELRSLTIRKPILDKCTALQLESLPPEKWSKLENLEKLTMTSSSLKKFPKSVTKITALKKLDLSDKSELKSLSEDIGSKLKSLEELYMSFCDLQKIPISFGNLKALKKLSLSHNTKLKSLPEDIWSKLEHLEELHLRCCGLQQLPIGLGNLTALTKLHLRGNSKLKSLPEGIWSKLEHLEVLEMWGCGLQKLPISLSNLTALKKLDLCRNSKLKDLPEDIWSKLQNLEELDLRWCNLKQLPSSFSNLTELKKLALSGNRELKSLPGDIGTKLQNLEELDLRWCNLQQLPSSLSNLTALKKLNLSGNSKLKSLPEDIGSQLQNLEKLNLKGCDLKQLPNSLSNLTALKKLNLRRNRKLKSLPEDIGSKLQNLEKLNLKGCDLQQLPSSLSNLTALKKLDLSRNSELKSLPEDIGSKLQNLEKLNLKECDLKQLPNSLSSLTALKKLDLSGNCELKSLPEDIGTKLQNLEELSLWECGLQRLPNSFCNLAALKTLDLSKNGVDRTLQFFYSSNELKPSRKLPECMSDMIFTGDLQDKLVLNAKVTSIAYTSSGVTVTTESGSMYEGDYAIVTFSLGVLQRGVVDFKPQLPFWKRLAWSEFNMMTSTVLYAVFDTKLSLAKEHYTYVTHDLDNNWIRDMTSTLSHLPEYANKTVFHFYVTGRYAERLIDQPLSKTVEDVTIMFRNMFGEEPSNVYVVSAGKDPLLLGGHPVWPIGTSWEDFDDVRRPVDDRLFFAGDLCWYYRATRSALISGEETANVVTSCMNGGSCAYRQFAQTASSPPEECPTTCNLDY